MTALDALYLVTAVGLATGAVALATAGRAGASRALAAVLAINAALVARGVLAGAVGWVGSTAATVVAVSLFAAVPPLVALAAVRARSGGPLRAGDVLALGPFVTALVSLGVAAIVMRGWPGGLVEGLTIDALNVVAIASVAMAVGAGRGLPTRARRAGAVVLAVFVAHWACSQTAWVLGLAGSPRAAAFEAASVLLLLAFGIGAAAWGLRRLPAALLAAPTPLVPEVGPPEIAPDLDPERAAADAALADRLRQLLDGDRVWTDPELTVETLADRLREPTRDVSRVLGQIGGGFHHTVGARRVAQARRLLADEPGATVLEILFRAGFNSKSAFHRAFRRHTGMTPTAYRRALADGASGDGTADGASDVSLPVPGRPRADPG
ncbi:helix-turn-helix domain-containing protein [Rubrivirga sp. IMCC43871]|uniref:AraC family transcriptional regulator n=1 Tax=Rubrivirga sp. IMCC43871 TaxID=3391575 RepID=UPI0039903481